MKSILTHTVDDYDWVNLYCGNFSTTVEAALDCMNDKTFNLTETINTTVKIEWDFFLDVNNEIWSEDFTLPFQGLFIPSFLLSFFPFFPSIQHPATQ